MKLSFVHCMDQRFVKIRQPVKIKEAYYTTHVITSLLTDIPYVRFNSVSYTMI
jgi:hypothetical protein